MLLERALEYVHTPEVEHTANEWKERENGVWEISNRTYKMRYKISYADATDIYLVSWGSSITHPSSQTQVRKLLGRQHLCCKTG